MSRDLHNMRCLNEKIHNENIRLQKELEARDRNSLEPLLQLLHLQGNAKLS